MRIHSFPLAILVSLSGVILSAQTPNPVRALVEGDIVNASTSAPLSGARVKLERTQDEDPIYGKVDRQGHFVFRNLDPGFYQLIVDGPGFRQSRTSVDVSVPRPASNRGILGGVVTSRPQSQIPQAQVSTMTDDDGTIHAIVSAPMLAYATIVGKVTDPFGVPMAGANIEILKPRPPGRAGVAPPPNSETGNMRQAMVSADSRGEYRAGRLEPGTYWVMASRPDIGRWTWQSGYRITYYPAALDIASAQRLKVEAGQQIRADIQILRQPGVSVSGHLLGLPPPAASTGPLFTGLTLVPKSRDAVNADSPFTQAQKEFEFQDVLPGKYTIYAQTGDPLSDPTNPKPLFGLVKEVEIGPQDMAGLDLTLEPVKGLSGTVQIAGPCSTAPKFVQLQGHGPFSREPALAPIAADHTFELQNVPTGRYDLWVTGADQPYERIPLAAATKGSRDVLKDGLESPWKDDDVLKITVACPGQEVRQ
jgi:hypothetical protein